MKLKTLYKQLSIIIFLLIPITFFAQRKDHEIGVFGGISYYMGEVNQQKLFYNVNPSFGFIYKIDMNPRYAIRISGIFGSLSGSDADFNDGYQRTRNYSFTTSMTEFAAMIEFNFFPYKPESRYEFLSPYFCIGIGALTIPVEENSFPVKPVIPFGIGVKYAVTKKLGIAAEWTYRKTFTDYLDQLSDDEYSQTPSFDNKQRSSSSSKDWYSFAGITLTYKFVFGSNKCPAYRN